MKRSERWLVRRTATVVAIICMSPCVGATGAPSSWDSAAQTAGVDKSVLYAMALWESARRREHAATPWPWTLRWAGGSQYFDSDEAAVGALKGLLAAGYVNIDVGLMQVNWRYHAERLADGDPERMLDPEQNLRMAALILRETMVASGGDLERAVARYHSSERQRGANYAARVLALAELLQREGRVP